MEYKKTEFSKKLILMTSRYLIYALFLSLFLVAFTTYRRLILGEYQISYAHYGIGVIEAFILAKLIIIGQELKIGERLRYKPLIISTLYKTAAFMVFMFLLIMLEHFVIGYISGKNLASIYDEIFVKNLDEILARTLIMFFFFVLFFALLDIENVLGKGILYRLFIKGEAPNPEGK